MLFALVNLAFFVSGVAVGMAIEVMRRLNQND
jgi:hypothetical protein